MRFYHRAIVILIATICICDASLERKLVAQETSTGEEQGFKLENWQASAMEGWEAYTRLIQECHARAEVSQYKKTPGGEDDKQYFKRSFEFKRTGNLFLQDAKSTRFTGKLAVNTRSIRGANDNYFFELLASAKARNLDNPQVSAIMTAPDGLEHALEKSRGAGALQIFETPNTFMSDNLSEAVTSGRLTLTNPVEKDGPYGKEVAASFTYHRTEPQGAAMPALNIKGNTIVFVKDLNWCVRLWSGELTIKEGEESIAVNVACEYDLEDPELSIGEKLKRVVITKINPEAGSAVISDCKVKSFKPGPLEQDEFRLAAYGLPESIAVNALNEQSGSVRQAGGWPWPLVAINVAGGICIFLAFISYYLRRRNAKTTGQN